MTNEDAQKILSYLAELEFPKLYLTSLQFALFKVSFGSAAPSLVTVTAITLTKVFGQTYGIPTISTLLVATRELSTPENASKRYADTGILIGEFTSHHPKSERAIKALARMNYIHGQYQKAGKISNSDLLYTLSVFITEPVLFIKRYEWRELTPMEICAMSTIWKSIGDSMGISYSELPRYNTGWKDGLEFYEDISSWAESYENNYMVPAESNKQTADELVPLLLFLVPSQLKAAGASVVGVLMGNKLRTAMM